MSYSAIGFHINTVSNKIPTKHIAQCSTLHPAVTYHSQPAKFGGATKSLCAIVACENACTIVYPLFKCY